MPETDLELYSTRELINELMRRKTFIGVIVHAKEEIKSQKWAGERTFTLHWNDNLQLEEAGRLLDVVADHLERLHG